MEPQSYLDAITADGAALAAAAATDLEARVPSCPEWDIRHLVAHMGRVHQWVTAMVTTRSLERLDFPPPPASVDLSWFAAGVDDLVAALADAGTDAPVWTFEPRQPKPGGLDTSSKAGTARFWYRRQAVETAVHRWDAELTFGEPSPIATELALAGIDELFDVLLVRRQVDLDSSVHFHATDSPHGEWTVRADHPGPDGPERPPERGGGDGLLVGHGHEKGDAALRATASDLLLWLWGRSLPPERLEVFGDPAVLRRVVESDGDWVRIGPWPSTACGSRRGRKTCSKSWPTHPPTKTG